MNHLKTVILLAGLTALFGGAGLMLGGEQGMIIALGIALVMNIFTYWFSDKVLLRMYGAKQVTSGVVHTIVRELAHNAQIPTPKVYVIETDQPNAFATGRNPAKGAVAVTHGIIDLLNERELRGVIAHELAHIKSRDTMIMTITATIAGALSMLANFAMFFGGRRDQPGGIFGTLAVMILAPIAAMLVQMAISRTREYAADKSGAEICEDPLSLASALEKIEYAAGRVNNYMAEQNPATAHLFIINPLHMHSMDNLFSTHPNTKNRVKALQEIASGFAYHSPRSPWNRAA